MLLMVQEVQGHYISNQFFQLIMFKDARPPLQPPMV